MANAKQRFLSCKKKEAKVLCSNFSDALTKIKNTTIQMRKCGFIFAVGQQHYPLTHGVG
jgi:hypothetical protein